MGIFILNYILRGIIVNEFQVQFKVYFAKLFIDYSK